MPLTLESRTRRMQVFHVPHAVGCQERCICTEQVVVTTVEHPRTGERAQRSHRKMVPGSITFLALERKANLPGGLLRVVEIKEAIDRGYLRVVEQTPDPSMAAARVAVATLSAATPPAAVTTPPAAATTPTTATTPPSAVAPAPVAKPTSFVPGSPAVATNPAAKEPS